MKWQVYATDSANTMWVVLFRSHRVARIEWARELDYPMRALDRIRDALNGHLAPCQPRCWSFGEPRHTGWPILHNGAEMGEITWTHPPCDEPDRWQTVILAGLNHTDEGRLMFPPAPARPRHLRAVS